MLGAIGTFLRRRAENISRNHADHDVRRAARAGLSIPHQHADGLDRRAQPHHVDLARPLGRGLRGARKRRDQVRPPPRQRPAACAPRHDTRVGCAIVVLFLVALPAVVDYIAFMRVQRTAYFHLRFDWLFSIILFAVAAIARYLWIGWRAVFGSDRQMEAEPSVSGLWNLRARSRSASPPSPCSHFSGCRLGYAMIAGSLIYLIMVGQDLGTVAEQLLNGMRERILLAIPMFILAAEVMNTGSMTERLLRSARRWWAASVAGWRRSMWCRASCSRACPAPR